MTYRVLKNVAAQRHVKVFAQITIDACIAACALIAALLIRYDGAVPAEYLDALFNLVPLAVVCKTLLLYVLRNYRYIWHYMGVREMEQLVLGALAGTVVFNLAHWIAGLSLPLSVILLDALLYVGGLVGVRFLRRMQVDHGVSAPGFDGNRVPTLFVGAGDTAHALLKSLGQSNHTSWEVVGLLDDEPQKRYMMLSGHAVLGPTTELEQVVDRYGVQHIVIAMPHAPKEVLRDLLNRAQRLGVTVQAVPHMIDLIKQESNGVAHPNFALAPQSTVTIADLADSSEVKKTLLGVIDRRSRENKVLVTGGAGYIGAHVVRGLLDEGYSVRVLDNFSFGTKPIDDVMAHPRLEVVDGDISSIRDVVSSVKDVGSVIALAAVVGDPACGINAEETLTLNYESTKVLVEACSFYGVGRLVFASSCSVYGASDHNTLHEESPLNPVSLYARTRILSENVIFERCRDVAPVVLRLSTVFGLSPRMRYDLVINALTARALMTGSIQIFGGTQQRPFIHCHDAAQAFVSAVTAPVDRVRGQIFNVGGNDMNYTIAEAGEIVATEVGDVKVEYLTDVDDPRNYHVAFDKIRKILGFEPAHDLRSGIREMIAAIETTPYLRDYNDPVFSNVKVMQDLFESNGAVARAV